MPTEEAGIVSIRRSGKYIIRNDVSERAPSEDINNIKSNRIIRFQQSGELARSHISRLEVRNPVLLRQALLRQVLSLEIEEHEPTQKERQARA